MIGVVCKVLAFCVLAEFLQSIVAEYTEVKAHVGQVAELPCRVDTTQCGKLHSVKWYRDTSRIYVFSQVGGIKRGEGDATERMEVEYEPAGTKALLRISPVEIEDDADYKCEITYWEVREHCDIVQIIKLTTLVVPDAVRILDEKGGVLGNATRMATVDEGTRVVLRCEAHGGRPIANVSWLKNGKMLKAEYSAQETESGVGTGVSTLPLIVSRDDLLAEYVCSVESDALETPIKSFVYPDVQVRPTSIELNGLKDYAYQGDEIIISCIVRGAKPAATIKWQNNTAPLQLFAETKFQKEEDGTFTTISNIKLALTRFENNREFRCLATNVVMTNKSKPPLTATKNVTVYYPPVVMVRPPKVTTFENSSVLLHCDYKANPKTLNMVLWQKDGQNLTLTDDRFEGVSTEYPSLRIKGITRNDMGTYTCTLRNSIGVSSSASGITLSVTFPPEVEVLMSPNTPVREKECANVTLQCKINSGNPAELEEVKWYVNGELAHEVNCSKLVAATKDTEKCDIPRKCNIDPSLILLERVQRSFAGSYSCQGKNSAGWGLISKEKELLVYYPPHATRIRYSPSTVIKGSRVTLECDVDDPGSPSNITFQWFKGSYLFRERNTSKWVIDPVTLSDRTNFTCYAVNDGGYSKPHTVYINVLAPPAFIQKPAPYYGILASSKNFSLTCQIECYPPCSIKWLKDGKYLETKTNPLFYIIDRMHPADILKNDFESVESTLVFNISSPQWATSDLTTQYTCKTEGNGVGPNITADVEIEIEFPPEAVVVSKTTIKIKEHESPEKISCSGKGRPNLSYSWTKNGSSENITFGEFLQLGPMLRTDAGAYVCNAWNKHGTATAAVNFDVLYPPECSIKLATIENSPALICSAMANPDVVTFLWRKRVENYSIEVRPKVQGSLSSYVILDTNFRALRTYVCYANNSVGESSPCEIDVPGNTSWWQQLDTDTIVLIVASVISIFICTTVLCIIIVLLCKKKSSNNKYGNHMELEEREKFLCNHSPDVLGLPLVPCGRVTCLGRPVPHHFSTEEKTNLGANQQNNLSAKVNYADQDKRALYENLPFHEMQHPSNQNTFYTLTAPQCQHLNNHQYAATLPRPKHTLRDPAKSKTLTSKAKQKKHFQIHLQKCQSLRFQQTAESCFQQNGYASSGQRNMRHKGEFRFEENLVQLQYQQPGRGGGKVNGFVGSDGEASGRLKERSDFMPEIVLDVR